MLDESAVRNIFIFVFVFVLVFVFVRSLDPALSLRAGPEIGLENGRPISAHEAMGKLAKHCPS